MDCFYTEGLNFSCKRCSHCCTTEPGYVYLSDVDFENLLNFTKLSKENFINKFCRWVAYYDGSEVLCLREKKNYDCILWENGGCSVYSARPIQCKTYPFWSNVLQNENSWNNEIKDCPGINSGDFHSFTEINEKLTLYKNNKPLKKGDIE